MDATQTNNEGENRMLVKLKIYGSLCSAEEFEINGVKADTRDFGDSEDADPGHAEYYSCGDMQFYPVPSAEKVLEKYSITQGEYSEVCKMLQDGLSFGTCGMCS